jgi:predicted secreted protein
MTWTSAAVIFIIIWWLVFFISLPLGVKPPHEAGEEVGEGHEAGAPVKTLLGWKVLGTTIVSLLLWGLVYWIISDEILTFRGV